VQALRVVLLHFSEVLVKAAPLQMIFRYVRTFLIMTIVALTFLFAYPQIALSLPNMRKD